MLLSTDFNAHPHGIKISHLARGTDGDIKDCKDKGRCKKAMSGMIGIT